jgi:formylglycine-generating enzyme required for sulfatase activity
MLGGGEFDMGTDARDGYPRDGEGPVHRVRLGAFGVDAHAVVNERYCNRYRVDSRSGNEPDTSTGNLGFRVCVASPRLDDAPEGGRS